jgi:hypothetical protein
MCALAIGATFNFMTEEDSRKKLFDNSTLKSLYHYSVALPSLLAAEQYVLDGKRNGVFSSTTQIIGIKTWRRN